MIQTHGKKKINWLRPTTRAEKALQDAQEYAGRDGGGPAGPHHLLLALVREPRSSSARLLGRLGVSAQAVGEEVRRASATARAEDERRPPEPSRAARRPTEFDWARGRADLLDPARTEAQLLGVAHVGTEHLLLGLLCAGGAGAGSVAGQALDSLGVTRERACAALSETDPPSGASEAGGASEASEGLTERAAT